MKVIPLSEAMANLSHYGRSCREEPIIVTVNGVPSFPLVPRSEEDDLTPATQSEHHTVTKH